MRTRREVSKKSTFPSSFDRFQRGFVNVHTYIYIYTKNKQARKVLTNFLLIDFNCLSITVFIVHFVSAFITTEFFFQDS